MEYDVIVIGGGPGGYVAAFKAVDAGLDVTLIDPEENPGESEESEESQGESQEKKCKNRFRYLTYIIIAKIQNLK